MFGCDRKILLTFPLEMRITVKQGSVIFPWIDLYLSGDLSSKPDIGFHT